MPERRSDAKQLASDSEQAIDTAPGSTPLVSCHPSDISLHSLCPRPSEEYLSSDSSNSMLETIASSPRYRDKPAPIDRQAEACVGPFERDLSKLAARLQPDPAATSSMQRTAAGRVQRPLQIHLDVAAVEHDIDTPTSSVPAAADNPGLLSHYLQLAEIDQQRERLGQKQLEQRRRMQQGTGSRRRRIQKLRDQLHASSLSRNRTRSHSQLAQPGVPPGAVGRETSVKKSMAATVPDESLAKSHNMNSEVSVPDDLNDPADISEKVTFAEEKKPIDPPATSKSPLANRTPPPMRAPFSSVNLTQFLPYALSSPGLQSLITSPAISRANSISDMDDWMRRHGPLLDSIAPTPRSADHEKEAAILNAKRKALLDGIQKLLLHQRFLCLLAETMMQYGAPLHHLEDNLSRMARHLCITATFTTLPGLVLISIEDTATFTTETKIIRCPNGYDMHRLELTDRVFRRVSRDKITVEEALSELDQIMSLPPLFAWYWQVLDWGLASWSVCLLAFSGSWWDSLAALILGIIIGCLNLVAGRLKGYTNLFEVSVSILSGFAATIFPNHLCFASVTLSATVVLLPGLVLTTGVIELTSRNMHAGTIRVFYALMLAFIIAFGIELGNNIFVEIFSRPDRVPNMDTGVCSPVSRWYWWLTFPVSICSICLLINVHPRDWHACVIVGGAMFAMFWYMVMYLKLTIIGPVVAAFVLGLVANLWSKVFKHNAYAVMLPGMMILVPGSVGVRGILSMFTDSGSSTQLAVQMIRTSLSIMTGLFASTFVVYPRGKKNSALLTV